MSINFDIIESGFGGGRERDSQYPFNYDLLIDEEQFKEDDPEFMEMTKKEKIDAVSRSQIDVFLTNVYKYFLGRGFRNIIVSQIVNLLLVTFLVMFCIFLFSCVRFDAFLNMKDIQQTYRLGELINWDGMRHMHWYLVISVILFCVFFVWRVIRLIYDVQKMWHIKRFYEENLRVNEFELSTMRWQTVIDKIQQLQSEHNFYLGKDEFTLHNVANHILKKENYMIAMFNKDIFDFKIPFLKQPFLTASMEWNLHYAVINYIFDDRMKLKPEFRNYHRREELANGLQKRFALMGTLNLLLAPFLSLFLVFWYLFEKGQEIYKNPGDIKNKEWSKYAHWKFREFNELPHVFYARMKLSSKYADEYLQEFPSFWISNLAKLGAFITSTFVFVLLIGTIMNDVVLFNLEISPGKSVFWYMGILGTILLLCRSFVKDKQIFFPGKKMEKIAKYIHYIPDEWIETSSTYETRSKLTGLYEYTFWGMFKELIGLVINPILMWVRLRNSSLDIIDFVRDYTLPHKTMGYLCKFAVFQYGSDEIMNSCRITELDNKSKDQKLQKSIYHFQQTYRDTSDVGNDNNAALSLGGSALSHTSPDDDVNDLAFSTQSSLFLSTHPPHPPSTAPSTTSPTTEQVDLPAPTVPLSLGVFTSGLLGDVIEDEEESPESKDGPNLLEMILPQHREDHTQQIKNI